MMLISDFLIRELKFGGFGSGRLGIEGGLRFGVLMLEGILRLRLMFGSVCGSVMISATVISSFLQSTDSSNSSPHS